MNFHLIISPHGFRDTEREAHKTYMEVATSANVTKTAREVRARLGIAAH